MAAVTEEVSRTVDDIDRLALRISLADIDEQFEIIVQKSLVFILKYLSKYEDHRKKLMELLGDVTRRLKCRPNIQVPVNELFLSYNDPSNSVFLINFSHMYIRLGFPRLPLKEKIKLLPVLFASLTDEKPICQRDALLQLTIPVLEDLSREITHRDLCLSELPYQRRYITDFFSLVMLLPYKFVRFDGSDCMVPDGFNAYDLVRVLHERFTNITSVEELEKYKVGILTFYSRHFFPAEESIIPVLFGYGDSRHSVVSIAAKELRTLSMLVDWEDETLLNKLLAWYLGRGREFDPKGRKEPRRPLSTNMRIKLGHYLMRSRLTFPGSLAFSLVEAATLALEQSSSMQNQSVLNGQTVTESATSDGVSNNQVNAVSGKTEDSTVQTNSTQHVQRSASATSVIQQRRLAEHGLDLFNHLINNMTSLSSSSSTTTLRCLINFVYEKTTDELSFVRARGFEILSRFLARDPNYLLKDPAQLPRLFDVLSEDNSPELKMAAAHCLRRLAVTLHEAQKQNYPNLRGQLSKLERLLYENIEKPDPLSRLVAVNFAGLIYPSDHIPTRYLILQALGDKDPRVRAEACIAFEQFLVPNIIHDIVYGRVKLPSFVEFVNHDTQHSRKNPFVEVERLIPVVQFIRLCLLATRGALTPAQEAGLTYETEDEVRYLINQTVRYFLSAKQINNGSETNSCIVGQTNTIGAANTSNSSQIIYPEQAKRSIDTYFRLIQVVIFTRSQNTKDSPDFPNYLEEVLVGNTKELITCNKQLFDRMNSVLLATPRGASCRHACASVYSVVVMETETPAQALRTARGMLDAVPKPGTLIDGESSHAVQGMFMGAAYLLERLFTAHIVQSNSSNNNNNNKSNPVADSGTATTKKSKKEKQQQQKVLQSEIIQTIEHFINIIDVFLVKPANLIDKIKHNTNKNQNTDSCLYVNGSVAQTTIAALLEALVILARTGCLSHLPAGSLPISTNVPLLSTKASLVHRIALYLPNSILSSCPDDDRVNSALKYQRVSQASLRALSALCMGEGFQLPKELIASSQITSANTANNSSKKTDAQKHVFHPHTIDILKLIADTSEINDSSLHLAVGTALADCLLGCASPYKNHWYERVYPLKIPQDTLNNVLDSPAGHWLSEKLVSLLKHRPGQIRTRTVTVSAILWVLNLVRRFGTLPKSILSHDLLISLLDEKDESVQCVTVATLGLIYDRSSENERNELVSNLTKVVTDEKKHGSLVYRELCSLAHQIGRPDLALSLIVLAISLPANPRSTNGQSGTANNTTTNNNSNSSSGSGQNNLFSNVAHNLASSVTYSSLVRRLGRSLAPVLPRLLPRIFIRRFDYARPKLRESMENVWLGLVLYASSSVISFVSYNACNTQLNFGNSSNATNNSTTTSSNTTTSNNTSSALPQSVNQNNLTASSTSLHSLASELIEAHFNAIICEIKTQLGFNTVHTHSSSSPTSDSSAKQNTNTTSPNLGTGTQNLRLRDACCSAIANLTTHPSADKRLAGHLPALLAGLLCLCDENESGESYDDNDGDEKQKPTITPAEEAAIAVQKLVIRVLENPCSRETSTGLLPGLLPVIIDRAPWSFASDSNSNKPQSESHKLTLELLLAAARTTLPSALRPALPQLIIAGLHTMWSVHPFLVSNLMRQPLHHLHLYSHTASSFTNSSSLNNNTGTGGNNLSLPNLVAQQLTQSTPNISNCREVQMAEILRLCIRLIDDVCLSRLIVPFTELIRAGGSGSSTIGASSATGGSRGVGASGAAAVATATCVLIGQLATINTIVNSTPQKKAVTCARCSTTGSQTSHANDQYSSENQNESPIRKLYNSPLTSSHSSPSSTYGVSPSTPPNQTAHESNPYSSECSNSHNNRCRVVSRNPKHNSTCGNSHSCSALTGSGNCCGNTNPTYASLSPHTGKLLAALLSALPGACRHPNSAGKTVQIEMARTLSGLLRFAKDTTIVKLFNRVRSWYLQPELCLTSADGGVHAEDGISISHWACVRVLHAVSHQCPDLLYSHAGITLPLIFINREVELDIANASFIKSNNLFAQVESFINNAKYPRAPIRETLTLKTLQCLNISVRNKEAIYNKTETADYEIYRQLWQESWEELVSRIPTSPCSTQSLLFWPSAVTLSLKSILPLANGFANSFLRRPLFDHSMQLICEALLESPSWTVRSQAAFTLLQLSCRLIGQPFFTNIEGNQNKQNKIRFQSNEKLSISYATNPSTTISQDENSIVSDDMDLSNNGRLSEDEEEIEDKCMSHAWLVLLELSSNALAKCKPWPGKVYILRSLRLLSQYALEQSENLNSQGHDIINQLWPILLRETKQNRADSISSIYRAEAYATLAAFSDAFNKNSLAPQLNKSTNTDNASHSNTDKLEEIFNIIVPDWNKTSNNEAFKLNTNLTDLNMELMILTIGLIWPLATEQDNDHLKRLPETLKFLVDVMSCGTKPVQIAVMSSILTILTKVTPDQSAQLVTSLGSNAINSFGLEELFCRIKKAAENPKSVQLREYALAVITAVIKHRSLLTLMEEQVNQIIQVYANDGSEALRLWSTNLVKLMAI